MGRKKTTEEFIEDARNVHGDRYLYDKTVYVNAKEDVIITCREHGDFPQRATNHIQGRGCEECGGTAKYTIEKIKNNPNFKSENIIINKLYQLDGNSVCDCECVICKHTWSTEARLLTSGCGCPKCVGLVSLLKEEVELELLAKLPHIKLKSETYNHAKEINLFYCETHNFEFDACFDDVRIRKYGCKFCGYENNSVGENNANWNPSLTQEDRLRNRNTPENSEWSKSILENYSYTCVISKQVGGKLNAHHLNGYHWDVDNRFNIMNGVVLSEEVHKEFHRTYGIRNNTREQFEEFYLMKTGEEFTHILKGEI